MGTALQRHTKQQQRSYEALKLGSHGMWIMCKECAGSSHKCGYVAPFCWVDVVQLVICNSNARVAATRLLAFYKQRIRRIDSARGCPICKVHLPEQLQCCKGRQCTCPDQPSRCNSSSAPMRPSNSTVWFSCSVSLCSDACSNASISAISA